VQQSYLGQTVIYCQKTFKQEVLQKFEPLRVLKSLEAKELLSHLIDLLREESQQKFQQLQEVIAQLAFSLKQPSLVEDLEEPASAEGVLESRLHSSLQELRRLLHGQVRKLAQERCSAVPHYQLQPRRRRLLHQRGAGVHSGSKV